MGYTIVIHHLAAEDIVEIARWYDYKLPGLGNKFEADLENTILKLSDHPAAFAIIHEEIRRIKLKRFPYLVFYQIIKNETHIYGMMHSKRNPVVIKNRFRNIF